MDNGGVKAVALTIDDGPRRSTERILDILEKYGAHATFFLIGNQINEQTAPTLERIKKSGCEIGNHGMNHSFKDDTIAEEFSLGQEIIHKYTGEYPTLFRPAGLNKSKAMFDTVTVPVIGGYLDYPQCPDWDDNLPLEPRIENMRHHLVDGRIILIHDTVPNIEMLEIMIPEIKQKGFEILTVTELFALKGKTPPKDGTMLYEFK